MNLATHGHRPHINWCGTAQGTLLGAKHWERRGHD